MSHLVRVLHVVIVRKLAEIFPESFPPRTKQKQLYRADNVGVISTVMMASTHEDDKDVEI